MEPVRSKGELGCVGSLYLAATNRQKNRIRENIDAPHGPDVMATNAAAQLLSKGPLSSALGQWAVLGIGTYVVVASGDGNNVLSRAAHELAGVAFRILTGVSREASLLREEAALAGRHYAAEIASRQPMVIYQRDSRSGGWIMTIVHVGLGATACWTAYVILSNFVPDAIKELMPVTRKYFETAVTSLGQGILRVREALTEQLVVLGMKQEELAKKQGQVHDDVLGLRDDLGDVRRHVDDIAIAISRCEGSLTDAAGRQTYMSKGVQLLVKCVGDLLRPGNPEVAEELDRFSRLSSEMLDGDEMFYRENNDENNNRGRCRSLSEIGSDVSSPRRNHRSLSRSRSSRPQDASKASSSTDNTTASSSSSEDEQIRQRARSLLDVVTVPTPQRMGVLRMLDAMNGGYSNNSSRTQQPHPPPSRSYSSPEDEVPPQTNSIGQNTPSVDCREDVEELLRIVRMM